MSLKLVSINIERSKHLDLVLPFIEREQPDVLCVQEIVERDIQVFKDVLGGAACAFTPTCLHPAEIELAVEGIGIFSRSKISSVTARYYRGSSEHIRTVELDENGNLTDPTHNMNCALLSAKIEKDSEEYAMATTHFTWSERGEATDAQRHDMRALLALLEQEKEFVLCGDFNAPRGGEIFGMLSPRCKDNIPAEYKTSIDPVLHRAAKDRPHEIADKMVDGLFTTPEYHCSNVRLVGGVSDHMAVVAEIARR